MSAHTGQPPKKPTNSARALQTSKDEQRSAVKYLIISVVIAAAMFSLWWLVASTNREGHHNAELLPLFTLFTLVPAAYHLARARHLRSKGK